jgi:hypothetical protein
MQSKLNIKQSLAVIEKDNSIIITCADRMHNFPPRIMPAFGFNTYCLSQAAFDHLRKNSLIEFDHAIRENSPNACAYWRVKPMYKVHIGYTKAGRDKWRKFETLATANAFCSEVFEKTGIVLSITGGKCS